MEQRSVVFRECVQDAQQYGSTDDYMVSRVWADIYVNADDYESVITDLKQVVGGDFDAGDIEVGPPIIVGSGGKPFVGLSQEAFADAARDYYRRSVAHAGIRPGGRGRKIAMEGNRFLMEHAITLPAEPKHGRSW